MPGLHCAGVILMGSCGVIMEELCSQILDEDFAVL